MLNLLADSPGMLVWPILAMSFETSPKGVPQLQVSFFPGSVSLSAHSEESGTLGLIIGKTVDSLTVDRLHTDPQIARMTAFSSSSTVDFAGRVAALTLSPPIRRSLVHPKTLIELRKSSRLHFAGVNATDEPRSSHFQRTGFMMRRRGLRFRLSKRHRSA
jgi:hypothetical protein